MATNQQAYREIDSARRTHVWQLILAGLGGAMIGDPVGTSLGGGEPDWSLAVVGAGLTLVSLVPLNQKVNRGIKRGVDIYNAGLETSVFPAKNKRLNGQGTADLTQRLGGCFAHLRILLVGQLSLN